QRLQYAFALVDWAGVASGDADYRCAIGRARQQSDRADLVRTGGGELMVQAQRLLSLTDGIEHHAGEHWSHRVQSILEGRDDAEIRTSAADTPEQIGAFLGAGRLQLSVRSDDVGRQQVVAGESVLPVEPAISSAKRQSGDTEMQSFFDQNWAPGQFNYLKTSLMRAPSDEVIEVLLEHAQTRPTPICLIYFQQLHGAASRLKASETAFPHRFDHYDCGPFAIWQDPANTEQCIRWARECWKALTPFYEPSAYVNAVDDLIGDDDER